MFFFHQNPQPPHSGRHLHFSEPVSFNQQGHTRRPDLDAGTPPGFCLRLIARPHGPVPDLNLVYQADANTQITGETQVT
jgi:hypothetical protein